MSSKNLTKGKQIDQLVDQLRKNDAAAAQARKDLKLDKEKCVECSRRASLV